LVTREILYRIAQEALANVARHSSASKVDLSIKNEAQGINLIIQDDGCGFELSSPRSGVGLKSMRERAEVIGGSFHIESTPGQGTQVSVTLPK